MKWDCPEAQLHAPPVQHCQQILRARGQCTVLPPGQSQEIRAFELPAVFDFDDAPKEQFDSVRKLLPAPRS